MTGELLLLDWLVECVEMCWDESELSPQHKIEGMEKEEGRKQQQPPFPLDD